MRVRRVEHGEVVVAVEPPIRIDLTGGAEATAQQWKGEIAVQVRVANVARTAHDGASEVVAIAVEEAPNAGEHAVLSLQSRAHAPFQLAAAAIVRDIEGRDWPVLILVRELDLCVVHAAAGARRADNIQENALARGVAGDGRAPQHFKTHHLARRN